MTTSDGYIVGTTKIVDHGPDSSRWNLVILSEGFRDSELAAYHTAAQQFVDTLYAMAPFNELWCAINVHRVDVVSTESGGDDPAACTDEPHPSSVSRATYFDATFCHDGNTRRLIGGDSASAWAVAAAQVPSRHAVAVIVNDAQYGGGGGLVAWFSLASNASLIGVHEFGHAAFQLADEYDDAYNTYTGSEPSNPNNTINTDRVTNKWHDLILAATPMPTMSNPNCNASDNRPSPVGAGTIGTFEGAHRYHCGIYRPDYTCRMRNLGSQFCAVCQRAIRQILTPFRPPESITLVTPSITFLNIPEGIGGTGVTTHRAIVFEVITWTPKTFRIVSGPTGGFGTPQGVSTIVQPPRTTPLAYARLWLSYTSTTGVSSTSGTVTVRCDETGEEWDISIAANTVARPKAAVVFVLDHSGSMIEDAGDGATKVQKLREASNICIACMLEGDAIGVVRYNHTSNELLAVTDVGPVTTGAGRTAAIAQINSSSLNPSGSTSIGGGIVTGKQTLDNGQVAATPHYDVLAMVVLTDGMENTPPMLASVSGSITANTFAIGLGLPSNISTAALNALTQGHNGYLLLTGNLTPDQSTRLSKYFLQILAGINNANVVLDPQGFLVHGSGLRIPFSATEADYGLDAILLSPCPEAIEFELETPDGQCINAAGVPSLGTTQFVRAPGLSYYRLSLPAIPAKARGSHSGTWKALLRLNSKKLDSWCKEFHDKNSKLYDIASRGLLPYNFLVHSYSSLQFHAHVTQSSYEPGAEIMLDANLTEYDVPVEKRGRVWAEIVRPDGSSVELAFVEDEPGRFSTSFKTTLAGLYMIRIRALGETLSGTLFSREQNLSAAVFPGGDGPGTADQAGIDTICHLVECLLSNRILPLETKVVGQNDTELARRLRTCLEKVCRNPAARLEREGKKT